MNQFLELFKKFVWFLHALFFTRDDDLDILQLLFAAIIVISLIVIWYVAIPLPSTENVKIEALVTLRWLAGLLLITAVPKWLVPFIANHVKALPKSNRRNNGMYGGGYGGGYGEYSSHDSMHENDGAHSVEASGPPMGDSAARMEAIPDEATEETSR
jgi:hypothetical protein